jgi:hypothetical protein
MQIPPIAVATMFRSRRSTVAVGVRGLVQPIVAARPRFRRDVRLRGDRMM